MSRAKLRRLKRATTVAGERSFTIHGFVADLPRADDDASHWRVPIKGHQFAAEEAASNSVAPLVQPLAAHKRAL
jgi:hypothetical protein